MRLRGLLPGLGLVAASCAPALHPLPATDRPENGKAATEVATLVEAAKTGVRIAEHDPDGAARARAAVDAVLASQRCVQLAPGSAACVYWLGASLGVQARERPTTAHAALPILIASFRRAAQADPLYEQAGPDRALALVYLRAPGWPAGPGDPDLGLTHAQRAVALRPEYPPNLLVLAEALLSTEDRAAAREACVRALAAAKSGPHSRDSDVADWLHDAGALLARLPEP